MAHEPPALPYAYNALEPYIDEQTMHLHHDKHHAAYCTNLNNAINGTEFEKWDVKKLLREPRVRSREHSHRRPQQRRRASQSLDVLGDDGPGQGRPAFGQARRRNQLDLRELR